MPPFEVIGAIVAALAAGYLLHLRFSTHASALQSLIQMMIAVVWILAAIASIATGFIGIGMVMLALFFYFFLGNYRNVRESDIPDNPRSWRRTASNHNPFGMERK